MIRRIGTPISLPGYKAFKSEIAFSWFGSLSFNQDIACTTRFDAGLQENLLLTLGAQS